ncbi:MAG: glycerol-3-phosphate acyltransferase [Herbinix sp.]|jgi:glycerol-3-phosphate acyltransferase PlsY|nr:glycerol-3-phosphate acyltransferase [Herbinix sp.]
MEYVDILIIIFSYLLGCINTGYYYTSFFYKQDIRAVGTNVTGAMNVSRIAGKKGFVITFLGDALKGALVVIICRLLQLKDITVMFCILMVILGHIFPLQLKFHGGKGLSTAVGAFLVLDPLLIIFLLITCAALLPFIRRYTVTSLFALMLLPLELFIDDYSWLTIGFIFLYMLILVFACRDNLKDYLQSRAYQGKGKGKDKY